ncbi:MAG TPA: hypothetical protein VLF71_05705 [Candidatus Saccharimonadales bacterium]|nr:hypothetical protein [Candidatus Saccharimonadales bacterium]
MEEQMSPPEQARALQMQLATLLSAVDIEALPAAPRETLTQLKRLAGDLRLDVRDFMLADSKAEQTRLGTEAAARLKQLEKTIAKAGELGHFGAADVAHLTAVSQQLLADLQE